MSFELQVVWLPPSSEPVPETKATTANLAVRVNQRILTRSEDVYGQTVTESIRVAAYPLALWFASNWWRLRWESATESALLMPTEWRMSHEMPAIGFGYVWPPARLSSDGRFIVVHMFQRSRTRANEPVHYLDHFTEECPAVEFEQALDRFIDLVLERLANCSLPASELSELWAATRVERADPRKSWHRALEARLGLDPDEDPDVVQRFLSFEPTCGRPALEELAAAHLGTERSQYFTKIAQLPQASSQEGQFADLRLGTSPESGASWERGRAMARELRDQLELDGAPLSDQRLGELLGLVASVFDDHPAGGRIPSVAIPRGDYGARFVLQKSHAAGRRFEGARLLGDHLLAGQASGWRVATDAKTYRQRVQRAFAAELLAPIHAIQNRLDDDIEPDRIELVAKEFRVSPLLVASQLANHGLLDPDQVPGSLRDVA